MSNKPPAKRPAPGPAPSRGRVADPSAYDVADDTWTGEDQDVREERDAMRDLEDPTFGFPIGSLAGGALSGNRQQRGDDDESTEVALLPEPEPRKPSAGMPAQRAARLETPTMEFTARVPPHLRERPSAPALRPAQHRTPSPPGPRRAAPVQAMVTETGEFELAPAPVDNSLDDLVDYADVPRAPPIDIRVVLLLAIFALSVALLSALALMAVVVWWK